MFKLKSWKSRRSSLVALCFAGLTAYAFAPATIPPPYAHPHGVIPALHAEHAAIHGLVADSLATHRAVKSGSWDELATWGGVVPGDGARAIIPVGIVVEYGTESNADIKTVRVDGVLRFSRTANTKLKVDTLVVTEAGAIDLGRLTDPITAQCRIVISGSAEIDPLVDPREIGKGIISQGYFYACGKAKTAWLDLTADPKVGDTKLMLESDPVGWEVGDDLVLAGTRHQKHQFEKLKVVSVVGKEVTFTPPLAFSHSLKDGSAYAPAGKFAFVQNLTRNVVIESEVKSYGMINPIKPWGMAPENKRRGHVMIHTSGVSKSNIAFARFSSLGRTDKRLLTSTPIVADDGTRTNKFNYQYWNPIGRYSLHWHRSGPATTPGICKGVVCDNSPGWGFTVHGANVLIDDAVAFDCIGSGFVTEDGSERGRFFNVSSIYNLGQQQMPTPPNQQSAVNQSEMGQATAADGHGLWTNAARSKKERIRIADAWHTGYFSWSIAQTQDEGAGGSQSFIRESDIAEDEYLRPYFVNGRLGVEKPAIDVSDLRTFSSGTARFEANNAAGKRSVVKNFEVQKLEIGYSRSIDFKDGLIYGNGVFGGSAISGTSFVGGLKFENVMFQGHLLGEQIPGSDANNAFKNVTIQSPSSGNATLAMHTGPSFQGSDELRQLSFEGINLVPNTPTGAKPKVYLWSTGFPAANRQWDYFARPFLMDRILFNGRQAYFADQAPDFIPYPTAKLSAAGAGTTVASVPPPYRDKTNQQLFEEFGTCVAGVPTPADAALDPVFGYPTGTPTPRLGIRLNNTQSVQAKPTTAYTLQVRAYKPGNVPPGELGYTVHTVGVFPIVVGWNVLTFELPPGEKHSVELFGDGTAPPPIPPPKPVASVVVTPASASVEVGKTVQLTAVAKDDTGAVLTGKTFTWSVTGQGLASVSSTGLVTGVAPGLATVSATCEGKTGVASIAITKPQEPPVPPPTKTIKKVTIEYSDNTVETRP